MKNILLLIALFLNASFQILAQKQKVPYFLKERKSIEFYKQQRTLWEEETKSKPKSEEAWLYLFTANRALKVFDSNPQWRKSEESIISNMEKNIPLSFTFNYCNGAYLAGKDDPNHFRYTELAYNLQPENTLVYKDMAIEYEKEINLSKRKEINQKWYDSGEFSSGLLNFTANLLNGLEPNSILFTFGDLDTYPIWMLQDVKGVRQDITVCNLFMMRYQDYRTKLFTTKGIVLPESDSKILDSEYQKGFAKHLLNDESTNLSARLIEAVYKNNPDKPIHIALSGTMKPLEDKLYLTGLSSRYSDKKFENLGILRKNYEKVYMLDYLKISFHPDPYQSFVDDFNQTYISSFLKLYKHYKESGDNEKASGIRLYIEILAKKSEYEKEIYDLLN